MVFQHGDITLTKTAPICQYPLGFLLYHGDREDASVSMGRRHFYEAATSFLSGGETDEKYDIPIFQFWRNIYIIVHGDCTNCHPHSVPFSPMSAFLVISVLIGAA